MPANSAIIGRGVWGDPLWGATSVVVVPYFEALWKSIAEISLLTENLQILNLFFEDTLLTELLFENSQSVTVFFEDVETI
jgi:hypothetical protein